MGKNEADLKANKKYLEKFDEIKVRVPLGEKAKIASHARSKNESMNAFVKRAVAETIERDEK